MIPARALTDLAVYLQTCAHIENAAWAIVRLSKREVDSLDHGRFIESVKLKAVTRRLVEEFQYAASRCPPAIAVQIVLLHSRIEAGLINRNLAAHGAFFVDDFAKGVLVEHYFSTGSGAQKTWHHVPQRISRREIEEAIDEADMLLREAVNVRRQLSSWIKLNASSFEEYLWADGF